MTLRYSIVTASELSPAELAAAHVDQVRVIARLQWRLLGGDLDDIVGDGMVGLMQAAHRFDASHGATFSGFAEQRIKGAIVDGYRRRNRTGKNHNAHAPRVELLFLDALPERSSPSAEDEALDRQALGRLLETLHEMPEHLREVIGAVVAGGRFRPIADRDGVSESAISQRLRTARRWIERGGPPAKGPHARRSA